MPTKLTNFFITSAATFLAAFATVLFVSNLTGARLTQPHDPLLIIPIDIFFWIVGSVAMAFVLACTLIEQPRFLLTIILWFVVNLIIYRLGLQWLGIHNPRGYFDGLARAFSLSDISANILSSLLFLYLFIGSAALLLCDYLARPDKIPLKSVCVHCHGHFVFSPQNLGQNIACPHCQKKMTLRKSDFLKMSCFFCHEHIEFPDHAIGEEISCPHCKMIINLQESATV